MKEWFKANLLSINFNKTHFMHFTAKSESTSDINITYDKKPIVPIINTKFLGIFINDTLTWKKHIDYRYIIPKQSTA
jgi:hypothetical protein